MDLLRQEIFYLGYHLHWSYTEVMALDITERHEYIRLLYETLEREHESVKGAARGELS
jgi:hypothetical protein